MGTEVQVLDEKAGNLVNYDPEFARQNVSKINALVNYAVKVKDEELMAQAAEAKEKEITQLVKWWQGTVTDAGGRPSENRAGKPAEFLSMEEAEEKCGFRHQRIAEWNKELATGEYQETLLEAWKKRAGLLPYEEKPEKPTPGPRSNEGASLTPYENACMVVDELSEKDQRRLHARLDKKFGTKALPAPEDKLADPEPKLAPRLQNAVDYFFNSVPEDKWLWLQQRMQEEPHQMKGVGIHVEWIEAFWACPPEERAAIKEAIKTERTRRVEG